MYPKIKEVINQLNHNVISEGRKLELENLVQYVRKKCRNKEIINLNFICTHNSRRSQLSQVWAKVAAVENGVDVNTFSGGVEVTAFNERAVESLKRFGFKIDFEPSENPLYSVSYGREENGLNCFSKLFNDPINPVGNFAAIMTCSDADENCPVIFGAEARIPLRYDDPKVFDGTDKEVQMYDERSIQIATEMSYVFSKIK